jgi:hypothetical protein
MPSQSVLAPGFIERAYDHRAQLDGSIVPGWQIPRSLRGGPLSDPTPAVQTEVGTAQFAPDRPLALRVAKRGWCDGARHIG